MIDGIEKRKYKRIGLKFQVEIENLQNHNLLELISRDISAGGLGISKLAPEGMEVFTKEELLSETPVAIKMLLPGCDEEISLEGTVVWSERSKTGIWRAGIEFKQAKEAIDRFSIRQKQAPFDKRTTLRYYHLFQIKLRKINERQSYIALSANLSSSGMQVFSEVLFATGTAIVVVIPVFGTDKKITIKAKVGWVRKEAENTWRMGINFDSPLAMDKFNL